MSEEFVEGTAAGGLTDDATSTGAKSAKMSQKVSITGDSDEDSFSYENKVLAPSNDKSAKSKLS